MSKNHPTDIELVIMYLDYTQKYLDVSEFAKHNKISYTKALYMLTKGARLYDKYHNPYNK